MPTRLWQAIAVTFAVLSLIVVLVDALDWQQYTDTNVQLDRRGETVFAVTGTVAEHGGLRPGDRVTSLDPRSIRGLLSTWPAGTVRHWKVERGAQTFETTTIVTLPSVDEIAFAEIINLFRFAMIAVALLVAVRRPDAPEARALVVFLAAVGVAAYLVPSWLPDSLLNWGPAVRGALLLLGTGYMMLFACLFPAPSPAGFRAALRRIARPLTFATIVAAWIVIGAEQAERLPQALHPFAEAIAFSPLFFIGLMAVASLVAIHSAHGLDRRRALWAAWSVIIGFSGVVVSVAAQLVFGLEATWLQYLNLTLLAIPSGLAYTILRHRTIDIGFVVSRALVLTAVSVMIIAAFGLLERAIGKLFIDMSHIASRTVEIALAIGLGFSLRSLHVNVVRGVDYVFFRQRQRSLAAMRAYLHDVFYITEPGLVRERTIELLTVHADAAEVAVIQDAVNASDDPLFVRLRASRQPVRVHDTATALHGEWAFPMVVRGELIGALLVSAKRSGETYDPVERDLLAEIAERVGIALDALQTQAIRAELEALRSATGGALPAF